MSSTASADDQRDRHRGAGDLRSLGRPRRSSARRRPSFTHADGARMRAIRTRRRSLEVSDATPGSCAGHLRPHARRGGEGRVRQPVEPGEPDDPRRRHHGAGDPALPGPAATIQCPATPELRRRRRPRDACDPNPRRSTVSRRDDAGSCAGYLRPHQDVAGEGRAAATCRARSARRFNVVDTTAPAIAALGPAATIQCPATPDVRRRRRPPATAAIRARRSSTVSRRDDAGKLRRDLRPHQDLDGRRTRAATCPIRSARRSTSSIRRPRS